MLPQYTVGHAAIVFAAVALLMAGIILFLSWCVRPLRPRAGASESYECGMKPEGDARGIGFNFIGYAALFLLFDLAALYLFLYAALERPTWQAGTVLLVGTLTLGLLILYATKPRRFHVA